MRGVRESKLPRLFDDTRLHVFECEPVRSSTRSQRIVAKLGGIYRNILNNHGKTKRFRTVLFQIDFILLQSVK